MSHVEEAYFQWMYSLICDDRFKTPTYKKLLNHLNSVEFEYILPMDEHRAADGVELRYRFGYEEGYDDRVIASLIDDHPCSILEMMLALAIRCEEHIMDDDDFGDRTGQWFWTMLTNLGLGSMHDDVYDPDYVDFVILRFLNREYKKNGEGGLFVVDDGVTDMRTLDIWYQLCFYINEIV